jgi:hypothetical protein
MGNLFDELFGRGAKPFRRDATLRITFDAKGKPVVEPLTAVSSSLSPDGSLDRVEISLDRFYHCGCSERLPIGNKCAEPGCTHRSCLNCSGCCYCCCKPICLEHSLYFSDGEEASRLRLCSSCHGRLVRRRAFHRFVRTVLSPFVAWESHE